MLEIEISIQNISRYNKKPKIKSDKRSKSWLALLCSTFKYVLTPLPHHPSPPRIVLVHFVTVRQTSCFLAMIDE